MMSSPEEIQVQTINHLGLIASIIFAHLQIGEWLRKQMPLKIKFWITNLLAFFFMFSYN